MTVTPSHHEIANCRTELKLNPVKLSLSSFVLNMSVNLSILPSRVVSHAFNVVTHYLLCIILLFTFTDIKTFTRITLAFMYNLFRIVFIHEHVFFIITCTVMHLQRLCRFKKNQNFRIIIQVTRFLVDWKNLWCPFLADFESVGLNYFLFQLSFSPNFRTI